MKLKTFVVAGIAAASVGAVAYAAAPPRSRAPAARAVQLRSQYNPFSLQREEARPQAAASVVVQSHRPGHPVRPPHRPPRRSPFQPPGRGPYFDPPGPPPGVPPGPPDGAPGQQ